MSRMANTVKHFVTWKRGNIAILMRIKYAYTVHRALWNINLIRNGQNALIEYQTIMLRLAMLSNKGDISCNKYKYRIPCFSHLHAPPTPHHPGLTLPSWWNYARPLPLCNTLCHSLQAPSCRTLSVSTTLYLHRLMTRSACPPGLAGSRL